MGANVLICAFVVGVLTGVVVVGAGRGAVAPTIGSAGLFESGAGPPPPPHADKAAARTNGTRFLLMNVDMGWTLDSEPWPSERPATVRSTNAGRPVQGRLRLAALAGFNSGALRALSVLAASGPDAVFFLPKKISLPEKARVPTRTPIPKARAMMARMAITVEFICLL